MDLIKGPRIKQLKKTFGFEILLCSQGKDSTPRWRLRNIKYYYYYYYYYYCSFRERGRKRKILIKVAS